MTISDVVIDAFERIRERVSSVATGLSGDDLQWRPSTDANSIAWLLWHLSRVQDDHVAAAAGTDQVWNTGGWFERFGLPFDRSATGYAFSADEVGATAVTTPQLLIDYHDAVTSSTVAWLTTLDDTAYGQIVDTWGGEPITLATRVVSVVNDDAQHVGQAAYVRGLLGR